MFNELYAIAAASSLAVVSVGLIGILVVRRKRRAARVAVPAQQLVSLPTPTGGAITAPARSRFPKGSVAEPVVPFAVKPPATITKTATPAKQIVGVRPTHSRR